MPNRSQRHLREIQGYDSSGQGGGGGVLPMPGITLNPTNVIIGDGDVVVTVTGDTPFRPNAVVYLAGGSVPTIRVDDTHLTFVFQSDNEPQDTTYPITVVDPATFDETAPAIFAVYDGYGSAPTLTPSTGASGASIRLDVEIYSNIENFVVVNFGGLDQVTHYVDVMHVYVDPLVLPGAASYNVIVKRGTVESLPAIFTVT